MGGPGAKGGLSGGAAGQKTVKTTYAYFANIAVGLCEGPIAFVRSVWADGKPLDLAGVTMRVHRGDEAQAPDPLIVAKEGAGAPAYRGTAYAVFERLPLSAWGNRVPQLAFEVVRPPAGGLGEAVRAVNLIPGAGEFAYETRLVLAELEPGRTRPQNRNQLTHDTDMAASLDQLDALCPNLESVTLIVAWFGDDLRAGRCTISPRVETADKATLGAVWEVAGLGRANARLVSRHEGRPAYGGTPSDESVLRAVAALKARGWRVNLHPFVMMDVPRGNALTDPRTGAAPQPAYPWRGQITPDPGRVAGDVAAFVGRAKPGDFQVLRERIAYSGPDEWSMRRHVLHTALLGRLAGGVDGFVIGSELTGLTRARAPGGDYPMAGALAALAGDVKALLGPGAVVTYGADWTEYGAHVPQAGSLTFPLDPLWASPHIDAVGIDWYPPLTDWRDGTGHLDAEIADGPHDVAHLTDRVAGGEGFDWYYASDADREAQVHRPIADGDLGKPWVRRVKDLVGWWGQPHVERAGGAERGATGWLPAGKPIWLLEIGCPAVDRGANGPHLFPDPKSGASGRPVFSRGVRDDLVQARTLEATIARFDPRLGAPDAWNPVSHVYGGRMVDPGRLHVWAWDARPYPAFPDREETWGDAANWETGHWLNGRLESAPLDRLATSLLADLGAPPVQPEGLDAVLDGYVVDRPMSARAALEPLARLYGFDLSQGCGRLRLVGPRRRTALSLEASDLLPPREGESIRLARAQETELPLEITVGFSDGERDYRRATATSRRLAGASRRQSGADTAVVGRRCSGSSRFACRRCGSGGRRRSSRSRRTRSRSRRATWCACRWAGDGASMK